MRPWDESPELLADKAADGYPSIRALRDDLIRTREAAEAKRVDLARQITDVSVVINTTTVALEDLENRLDAINEKSPDAADTARGTTTS